jgi:hypothetical protein
MILSSLSSSSPQLDHIQGSEGLYMVSRKSKQCLCYFSCFYSRILPIQTILHRKVTGLARTSSKQFPFGHHCRLLHRCGLLEELDRSGMIIWNLTEVLRFSCGYMFILSYSRAFAVDKVQVDVWTVSSNPGVVATSNILSKTRTVQRE